VGDYRVKDGSPALALGFVNFPMDRFGVQKPELKALARTPVLPGQKPVTASVARDTAPRAWLGASVRNVADMGEMSALGLPGVTGVLVLEVPAGSVLTKCGLQKGDVILSVDGTKTAEVATLLQQAPTLAHLQTLSLGISRQQKESVLTVTH
jgi:S1-C subfamily serine protease